MGSLCLIETILAIGSPYCPSAFAIFLLRETFKMISCELADSARLEGSGLLGLLWQIHVTLASPTKLVFGLVSVSHHRNNFIWPLFITSSVERRPLMVRLYIFYTAENDMQWLVIKAGTRITSAPILLWFLICHRQFVQSFMSAGIMKAGRPKLCGCNRPPFRSVRVTAVLLQPARPAQLLTMGDSP